MCALSKVLSNCIYVFNYKVLSLSFYLLVLNTTQIADQIASYNQWKLFSFNCYPPLTNDIRIWFNRFWPLLISVLVLFCTNSLKTRHRWIKLCRLIYRKYFRGNVEPVSTYGVLISLRNCPSSIRISWFISVFNANHSLKLVLGIIFFNFEITRQIYDRVGFNFGHWEKANSIIISISNKGGIPLHL